MPDRTHGRHELPERNRRVFSVLGVVLCLLLGIAIATQARQTRSVDALDRARPADLMVLLGSLQRQEAALNTEVAELQQTLAGMQAAGTGDQAAIRNAETRLAALSILAGTVAATGPGVTVTISDPGPGVAAQTLLDVLNELRAAGVETMEVRSGSQAVRVGVDTWVAGDAGALVVDSRTLRPPYSVVAIGDPRTLAAALSIPGGAVDSVERVGGTVAVTQSDQLDVTVLRHPKPRQYAQPVK